MLMRKLSHPELLARQRTRQKESKLPFCAVLNNVRSLYNVGSIFRTADGAGLEKLWLCGITGHPPDTQISKTALGAEKEIPWEYRKDASELLQELKTKGYSVVLLEQTAESISFQDYYPSGPVCLVVGNEIEGVSESLLPFCDKTVEIDMAGVKNSLNVTVAFGIVAYHFRNCLKQKTVLS